MTWLTRVACCLLTFASATALSPQRGVNKISNKKSAGVPSSRSAQLASSALEQTEVEKELAAFIEPVVGLGITAMRLGTCALMVHHGLDKIENVDGFSANVVAKFFGFLPGDPHFWTYSAAVTQVAGAGLLGIGLFSRPVALSMLGTMLAAVIFHLENTGVEGFPFAVVKAHTYNYELAAMYVVVLGYFTAAGAGPLSVDEQVLGGELAFYQKLTMQAQAALDNDEN